MKGNFKEARRRLHLNQDDVAALVGVPSRTFGSWERGEREISAVDAMRIAEIYGCSLDYLAGRIGWEEEQELKRRRQVAAAFDKLNDRAQGMLVEYCSVLVGNPDCLKDGDAAEGPDEDEAASGAES